MEKRRGECGRKDAGNASGARKLQTLEQATKLLNSDPSAHPLRACDMINSENLSTTSHEKLLYEEAQAWAWANRYMLQRRSQERGGSTTAELCERVGMPLQGDSAV